ncbi:MAG: DUF1549 domain-containing protein [Fimbriiglobus sp.]
MRRFSLVGVMLLVLTYISFAAETTAIRVFPSKIEIFGSDDAPQIHVTGDQGARQIDLTSTTNYTVTDAKVATIDQAGRITPKANGSTVITALFQGKSAQLSVTVKRMDTAQPINFHNTIEPILTKLSCNSGGCHGKIAGQNGFRLSLLGFDSEFDYMTLVKESRGRRMLPSAPDQSLFLLKTTGQVPHGGGKKTEVGSEEYKVLRRWIASGMPYGQPTDPKITKVVVSPESRVLDRNSRQQLVVHAHYTDGRVEDVTRRAQYESNETEVATVNETGIVSTLGTTGQAAVMVRFSGLVTVFQTAIPRPGNAAAFDFPAKTLVDQHTAKKWRELNIAPSELCSDEQFIRRVSLDIAATLPNAEQVRAFVADKDPAKRDKLVDKLLETPEYAYFFANKWADVLRVKRRAQAERASGTFSFHTWIREAIASDKPYNDFVREVLCAIGDEAKTPPTVWYKEVTTPEQFVDDVSQVFLGQRLACAQCHHHPYEKWSQDDYWGLASFFGRVGKKQIATPGRQINNQQSPPLVIYTKSSGTVTNKRTNKPAPMKPLDAEPAEVSGDDDPRELLADWMTSPKNPFFAKAVANRYWAHFFGRGIVDPLDDMRVTNPPSNPELLEALAQEFVAKKYSFKELIRTICKSRTYQLSSTPNETNTGDKQSYARYYPKRLGAEVLFDAVTKVTETSANFNGVPRDRHAPSRAIMLPDESFNSYFLDVLGRPQRISACECERVNEASLAMTLHLLNSQEVQDKLSAGNGRAERLARDPRPDSEKLDDLFLLAVGKTPSAEQKKLALEHITKHEKNKRIAYENILWALINSKAFLFNQ